MPAVEFALESFLPRGYQKDEVTGKPVATGAFVVAIAFETASLLVVASSLIVVGESFPLVALTCPSFVVVASFGFVAVVVRFALCR